MTYPAPEPAPNSYGTPEGVAALASVWTDFGAFFDEDLPYVEASNPTLTTVVNWIDEVSAMLNTALKGYGFVTPLSSVDSRLAADSVINGLVADLVAWANRKGWFVSDSFGKSGMSVWTALRNDLSIWVKEYGPGIEANGDPRTESNEYRIGSRGFDKAGEEIFPIFQRKGFGNRFDNWTKQ